MGRKRLYSDEQLEQMLDSGMSVSEVAKELGVHRNGIYRKVNRFRYEKFFKLRGIYGYELGSQGTLHKIDPVDWVNMDNFLDKPSKVEPVAGKYRIEQDGEVKFYTLKKLQSLILNA